MNTRAFEFSVQTTGATTPEAITRAFNERGIRAPRGGQWHASPVMNLLARGRQLAAETALS